MDFVSGWTKTLFKFPKVQADCWKSNSSFMKVSVLSF